jgi:hypothetical protein
MSGLGEVEVGLAGTIEVVETDMVQLQRVVVGIAVLGVFEVEFGEAVFCVRLDEVGDVVEVGDGDVAAVCAGRGVAGVVLGADAEGDDGG